MHSIVLISRTPLEKKMVLGYYYYILNLDLWKIFSHCVSAYVILKFVSWSAKLKIFPV